MRYLYISLLIGALGCPGPKDEDGMADSSPCTGTTWYTDADGDGYGDPGTPVESCEAPEGTVANASDCDDTRGLVYPGAQEICVDGVVNDCDAEDETAALDFCSGSGPFSLAGADAKLFGERADDEAGTQVVGVGDVDGDGKDDLLVATSDLVRETATVYLVSGPVGGAVSLGDAYAELPGDEAGTGYGQANAGAGDVDGDGYSDLLLGTTGANRAYLKLGPVFGEVSVQDADTLILGRGDRTGFSVAGLGDVDGDGLSDLLLGAPLAQGLDEESELGGCVAEDEELPEHGEDAGVAYLFEAPPTGSVPASSANATLIGEDGEDAAGWRVARSGDLDGDGLADLFLSAPGNCEGGLGAGAAYAVLSPASGDVYLEDADAKLVGQGQDAQVGMSLSGAGDTNGDGTPDLLVGDPDKDVSSADNLAGEVYLFLGPVEGSQRVSRADAKFVGVDRSYSGASISSAGDVDGDDHDDIVIGAWGWGWGAGPGAPIGATFILHGPFSGTMDLATDADTVFVGDENSYSGTAVAGAGDTDSDGLADVLVGAPWDDASGSHSGAAFLLLGGGALLSGDGEI